MKCLIADHEPKSLAILKGMKLPAFKITATKNASGALRLYESLNPELVLIDLDLPYPGGLNTIREIRNLSLKLRKNPIIIASSSVGTSSIIQQIQKQGADDFLLRPLSEATIYKHLEKYFPDLFTQNTI